MRFSKTPIPGSFLIDVEPAEDPRGFFANLFTTDAFTAQGLSLQVEQCCVAFNHKQGTLRGMHYQIPPATQVKLVRCVRGSIFDVIVDLRVDSPSYQAHFGVELSSENRRALFIPALCAHGYQSLTPDTEVMYLIGGSYNPGCEQGLRYNDPALGIRWPLPISEISAKDQHWPLMGSDAM